MDAPTCELGALWLEQREGEALARTDLDAVQREREFGLVQFQNGEISIDSLPSEEQVRAAELELALWTRTRESIEERLGGPLFLQTNGPREPKPAERDEDR